MAAREFPRRKPKQSPNHGLSTGKNDSDESTEFAQANLAV